MCDARQWLPEGGAIPSAKGGVPVHAAVLALLTAVALVGFATPVRAQAQPPPAGVHSRSHSGQFIVQRVPARNAYRSRLASSFQTNRNYITLDATILPISCERIKETLARQLGRTDPWSGRIFLALYTANSGDDPITVTSTRFRDGWQYQLELPDLLDRTEYVRSVIDVLLLEIANRNADDRSAEIPAWLSEGLCQELLFANEIEILLPPPRPGAGELALTRTVLSARKENPLAFAHQVLSASPALTFQQLSWPLPEQLTGESGHVYRCSSQLFVKQLLSLPNAAACLRSMLADLPRHYNWQFAFMQAFRAHFQRPLDVEKWWALQLEHFTGRDLRETWPAEESWEKFDALVRFPVQVHATSDGLPLPAEVKLQTIIREWEREQQIALLQAKVRQLEQLRLRLAPAFVPLADEYHRTLVTYLEHRDRAWASFRRKAAQRNAAQIANTELDRLDALLAEWRPRSAPATVQPRPQTPSP